MKNKKRVLALMLAGVLTLGCFPTTVGAVNNAYDGTKPADGTTKKQPFLAGTGGSTNFRIPGLVTLNDGTLVASSDARWNGGGDGGGLDTIVSRSTDNGKTWSYTFANYLGDNGNVHNNGSTAFIDPALTTDGGTVYMAADLYPAGTALNSASYAPKTGHTGYDSQHRLVLAKATDSVTAASDTAQRMNAAFTYYLEKNPDENATSYYLLKDASGNTVSGYTVDAYFNITGNGVNTNLFCGDSPYFPYPTDFIYVTKSTDGGETWSEPTLLDVKKASEQSLLVGPGRGIVISTGEHKGRIVFTCYEFTNGDKNSGGIIMTESEIRKLLERQRTFFSTGKTLPVFFRLRQLEKLKRAIQKNEPLLRHALKKDLGKSNMESYMCEIGLTLSELSWMQRHVRSLAKNRTVPTPLSQFAAHSYRAPIPYGTVLIMSPWNYPLLLTLEPLIDAIAAGNTVILKPSAYAPASLAMIKEIIETTFPADYISVIDGGRTENQALLRQKFDKIFFTGSKAVGKEVLRHAAENLTPVTLELGGKSPCIVDSTAKIPLAARRIVFGKFLNCGQTCVAPDYILCHHSVRQKLVAAIRHEIQIQFGESPLLNPDYGKIINAKHFQRLSELLDPEKIICGGNTDAATLRIEPTVMTDVTWEDAVMEEEIFGPLLPILTYDTLEEVIRTVESHPHPLALYFFSEDKASQKKLLRSCRFGGGCINDTVIHLATSSMPFGGIGESGMGSYHGKTGFETFSHFRSIVDKKTWMDLPIRYQKYTQKKEKLLRLFLQ